jgi:cell wall-associated NlpC family hydrolase
MPGNIRLEKYITVPYKKYGRDLSGMDCYGFVRSVLKEQGIFIPEYKFDEEKDQKNKFLELIPGKIKTSPDNYDIVYIGSSFLSGHIGIYIDNKIWHMDKHGVNSIPWKMIKGRIKGIYEIAR